ncbi:MAG TPA: RNHCP domain-containing protein [Candidatus Saccharimonadales bacterium]|nr:RNHCP domain-containing protein [Candidatus Saccharimonadales bacterium]
MKSRDDYSFNDKKKHREKEWKREHDAGGFRCSHCKNWVSINSYIGTANRNHCPHCLWSKHVDEQKGDREATCHGGMKPIGLTFKHEGMRRQGELMFVHECMGCGKLSINRIARDDDNDGVVGIFESSKYDRRLARLLQGAGIHLLDAGDEEEVRLQLFGRR